MLRRFLIALVATFLLAPGLANAAGAPDSVSYSSDWLDVLTGPADRGAADVLTAICPDHAGLVPDPVTGVDVPGCGVCPGDTEGEGPFVVRAVHRGAFSDDGSDEVLVAFDGCAAAAYDGGGSVLLQREDGALRVSAFFEGLHTKNCQPELLVGDPALACHHAREVRPGSREVEVFALLLPEGKPEVRAITKLRDDTGRCRFEGEFAERFAGMQFRDVNDDGRQEIVLRAEVLADGGEPQRMEACTDADLSPKAERRRIAWLFEAREGSIERSPIEPDEVIDPQLRREVIKPKLSINVDIGLPLVEGAFDPRSCVRGQTRPLETGLRHETTEEVIELFALRHRPNLGKCYEAAFREGEREPGTVTLGFDVLGKGKVANVHIVETRGISSPTVGECIERNARNWIFPYPEGELVRTKLPITFGYQTE